jgi:hypothetical protein
MIKTGCTITTTGFNKFEHNKPSFNTNGYQIPYRSGFENGKILSNSLDIPRSWGQNHDDPYMVIKTLTTLKKSRKMLPDPSYDLNGDGSVSAKEYKFAKYFDKDRDGILDSAEKAECIK